MKNINLQKGSASIQGILIGLGIFSAIYLLITGLLPVEFSVLPLSTWDSLLSTFSTFMNNGLGYIAKFIDVDMLLMSLKLIVSFSIIGFNIKLIQWVVKFFI
jgi:hypothetical protein